MKKFAFLTLLIANSSVFASDGQVSGVISAVDVTAGENYGFRISLKNQPALCGNTNTWAYLMASDSNYNTYVSVLLAAKLSEKQVTIHSNRDPSGLCHIVYINLL